MIVKCKDGSFIIMSRSLIFRNMQMQPYAPLGKSPARWFNNIRSMGRLSKTVN